MSHRTVSISPGSSHEMALALLSQTSAPGDMQVIETHMSWVYLVGDEVFKLKKPVRCECLDFTRLSAREAFCREEVRLNARLAPGVYLGLVALLCVRGLASLISEEKVARHDDVVDWLVHMKRLPRQRMLDDVIAHRSALPADVDALMRVLVDFYRTTAKAIVLPALYIDRLRHELVLCRDVLIHPNWTLPGASQTIDQLETSLLQHQAALMQRASLGRLVDGHGDLRPEHVCLLQPPVVIDCIEFSQVLRQVDPFDELAFLALECNMAGAGWIGERLIDGCAEMLGDRPSRTVINLYTAHRALVRARLSLAHLFDPQPRTPERWLPQAQRYLERVRQELDTLSAMATLAQQSTSTPCVD